MTKYRTNEQFEEIVESATNGNWSQAFKECVDYGFYANDLIEMYEEREREMGGKPYTYFDITDIARLAEGCCEARYKKD